MYDYAGITATLTFRTPSRRSTISAMRWCASFARGISTRSIPKSTWTCLRANSRIGRRPQARGHPRRMQRGKHGRHVEARGACDPALLVIDEDSMLIERAGFRCRGDIATIASASLITAFDRGQNDRRGACVSVADLKRELGKMPADRVTRPYLAVEAVGAMVGDFFLRQGRDLAWLDANLACDEFGVNCSMCEHCSCATSRVPCVSANRASVRLFRYNRIATARFFMPPCFCRLILRFERQPLGRRPSGSVRHGETLKSMRSGRSGACAAEGFSHCRAYAPRKETLCQNMKNSILSLQRLPPCARRRVVRGSTANAPAALRTT